MADEGGGSADERLVVMLEARISEFEKRMMRAERTGTKTYQGLQRGSSRATRQMEADAISAAARINQAMASIHTQIGGFAKAFAGGLAIGALNGIAGAARNAIGEMADLADLADQIGIDVENLQGLQQGLKLAGVEDATASLQGFTARLGDAAAGEGALAKVMEDAGVQLKDRNGNMRDTLDILRDYADVVQNSPDAAAKMALVTEAFGKGGKAMVLAMSEGSAGIDGMIAQARAAGSVIDEDMIRKAAELDDKFDQVGQRLSAIFKQGVISAAEFFGFIEQEQAKLIFDPVDTARLFGPDTAKNLAELPEVPQEVIEQVEALKIEYSDLATEARLLVPALSEASSMLRGLGDEAGAQALTDLASRIGDAANEFAQGTISGEEYAAKLRDVVTEAQNTIDAMGDLDKARLGGVIGQVSALLDWINQLPGAAQAARDQINALTQMDTGTPLSSGGDLLPPDATSPLAPSTSDRPRRAPALLGETGTAPGSGRGGGGGGGNSTSRLDAVLSDLQTEREAVTAWYAESQALLATATDAQLAQVGGRHEALERLEAEHQERLRGIRDVSQTGALASAETFLGGMAMLFAAGGAKLVTAQRVTAASEAFINTLRAQAAVLATPGLTLAGRFAAYAAIGSAGFGIVAALGGSGKSKKGGSSGGGGSDSGSGGTSTAQAAQSPLLVTLQGLDPAQLYQGSQIIALTDAIQKEFGKRGLQVGYSV